MPQEGFSITVGAFEGPLELVLKLVEERKMLVNDISLAAVADSFIEHIQGFEKMPLEVIAHFLVVATTLLLIKSRSLLPQLSISQEEEASIEELERRLRVYACIKAHVAALRERAKTQQIHMGASRPVPVGFRPPATTAQGVKELTLARMHSAIARTLDNLPRFVTNPQATIEKVVSIETMMTNILSRLQTALTYRLKGSNSGPKDKLFRVHVIVSFLALLELARRGTIALKQADHFQDIEVETHTFGIPEYT